MFGGGDLSAMLRILVVLGVNAALQQTLLLSPAPIQSNVGGGDLSAKLRVLPSSPRD